MANGDGRRVRVAVIFGGQSDEHDVSLRSAQTVIGALDPERYEVVPVGITRDGRWLTSEPMAALTATSPLFHPIAETIPDTAEDFGGIYIGHAPAPLPEARSMTTGVSEILARDVDVVFPVLHGPRGEDGTVQGLLELAGVPYVGSGVLGSSVGMDKAMSKTVFAQAGLPQVPWLLVQRRDWQGDPDGVRARIAEEIGFPCFVKPANMGSSVGVSKVHGLDELDSAMTAAAHHDRRIMVEWGVDVRELEVSVLGNEDPVASVVGEIVPANEFYDYEAKYIDAGSELVIPADLPAETVAEIQRVAVEAFRVLDLAGLARVDFFVERTTGEVWLNEVNTIPGFTATSMYPLLWEATGVPLPKLVDALVELALDRHASGRVGPTA
ncbi:MAG TPA: D-alanine--D-alanine ligase family protein [Thermomicrobiales bacterium]|jgi:D-alanine-D-alanine ligase|nr:D-alanine--D-alanine ligase family protein [Thermomicrobiales bacterium]